MPTTDIHNLLENALNAYALRSADSLKCGQIDAVMFDMDGILYDSMPNHAEAWCRMCAENGLKACHDEFFMYEGRTGASTIGILFRRELGREPSEQETKNLYRRKTEIFASLPPVTLMAGADCAVGVCLKAGAKPVIVTGSGQGSLLGRLDSDYPGAFPAERRVTAYDVSHGKPHPEPFLRGLEKAGTTAHRAVAVDNAPLGVESASRAGVFTIGVNTGPLPEGTLAKAGADIEVQSMHECAEVLRRLLYSV